MGKKCVNDKNRRNVLLSADGKTDGSAHLNQTEEISSDLFSRLLFCACCTDLAPSAIVSQVSLFT